MSKHITMLKKTFSPKRLIARKRDKSVIVDFAEKNGLVYFGRVLQTDDDHKIVKGLTVSVNHYDQHYCVGTYEGYDVCFVERSDTLISGKNRTKKTHKWHIFEFDLLAAKDLPHTFVGMHSHSESFYLQLFTKFPQLRAVSLGMLGEHASEFLHKYRVYAVPGDTLEVEKILSPLVTEMVSRHFGALAIELQGSSLYIYSEKAVLSEQLLDAMIKNGRWLADHIDRQAQANA